MQPGPKSPDATEPNPDSRLARTGPGRPSDYDPSYAKQAEKLTKLGATDLELAEFFEVSVRTIHRWKLEYPEFCHSMLDGKEIADNRVVRAMYQRCLGYEQPEDKAFKLKDADGNERVEIVSLLKHIPSDTQAASLWLRNRAAWKESMSIDASGAPEVNNRQIARKILHIIAQDASKELDAAVPGFQQASTEAEGEGLLTSASTYRAEVSSAEARNEGEAGYGSSQPRPPEKQIQYGRGDRFDVYVDGERAGSVQCMELATDTTPERWIARCNGQGNLGQASSAQETEALVRDNWRRHRDVNNDQTEEGSWV